MIFVTVGSQEPFERLIRAVDEWAHSRGRSDVFAQIAQSDYQPKHMEFADFMDPSEFKRRVGEAKLIVAHAGMGSIISALEAGKPLVVMPRRADFRETRNDHQVATVEYFGAEGRFIVAQNEGDLPGKLDHALTMGETERINNEASPRLLATIRAFLDANPGPLGPEPANGTSRRRAFTLPWNQWLLEWRSLKSGARKD